MTKNSWKGEQQQQQQKQALEARAFRSLALKNIVDSIEILQPHPVNARGAIIGETRETLVSPGF